MRVYRIAVWLGFSNVVLLLALALCWVDRGFLFQGFAGLTLPSLCNKLQMTVVWNIKRRLKIRINTHYIVVRKANIVAAGNADEL